MLKTIGCLSSSSRTLGRLRGLLHVGKEKSHFVGVRGFPPSSSHVQQCRNSKSKELQKPAALHLPSDLYTSYPAFLFSLRFGPRSELRHFRMREAGYRCIRGHAAVAQLLARAGPGATLSTLLGGRWCSLLWFPKKEPESGERGQRWTYVHRAHSGQAHPTQGWTLRAFPKENLRRTRRASWNQSWAPNPTQVSSARGV